MALSDTCRDTVDQLIRDFHNYVDWEYSTDHWNHYVSAIFSLADIEFELMSVALPNGTIHIPKKTPRLRADNFVLQNLLAREDSVEPRPEALKILSAVAMCNARLREAILDLHEWRQSDAGVAERLAVSNMVPIAQLYDLVNGPDSPAAVARQV